MGVVMLDVLSKDGFELTPGEDQHSVETLAADRAEESFGESVGTWRPNGRSDDPLRRDPVST